MAIVLGHWGEHLVQAYQIYVMGWPPAEGGRAFWVCGIPWLIKSEVLHYSYALVMLIGIWVLRKGFHRHVAQMVDRRAGDSVLASLRAPAADHPGHHAPQFLGQAGTGEHPAVGHSRASNCTFSIIRWCSSPW